MKIQDFNALSSLMETIGFDEEELTANRDGYMTKRQCSILNNDQNWWHGINLLTIVITPLAIGLTFWDGIRVSDTISSRIGITVFILVIGIICYIYTHWKWKQVNTDLGKGNVISAEGTPKLKSFRERNGMKYTINIENSRFFVSKSVFEAFQLKTKYRVYYAPVSKRIISAEPVE